MNTAYFGGYRAYQGESEGEGPRTRPANGAWTARAGNAELFLTAPASLTRIFTWDNLLIQIRGYARVAGSTDVLDLERVAQMVRAHYLENGTLAVDDLDGSFTLALLDGQAGRVLLYRNLIGIGATYYRTAGGAFAFSDSLPTLLASQDDAPATNRDALPALFLYRAVPGRETLFDGYYRQLPGEQLTFDARGLTRTQRHTFATLRGSRIRASEALDCLETTLDEVMCDCAGHRPSTTNLLSGGVDSSYLQVVWNRTTRTVTAPPSVSISVDHPRSWPDTDYAITMSQALGTRHAMMAADAPYVDYLADLLASTGEMPNHVQSAYFGQLARFVVEKGHEAGLCGEGADSLFGLGMANQLHNAAVARWLVPGKQTRSFAAQVARIAGLQKLAATLRRANGIDDFGDLEHPVNQVAVFADVDVAVACFGSAAIANAAAERRGLIDRLGAGPGAQDRLHAAGFLGEAAESASLWTGLFNRAGADLLCPFLDSRVLRLALNLPDAVRYRFRQPKHLLKTALARAVPAELARRKKLGFGQPIFEWLGPGGQLRPLVDQLSPNEFVDAATLERAKARPSWFLYTLLCFDLWHRMFIDGATPRVICAQSAVLTPTLN